MAADVRTLLGLFLAVLAVSWASIFIRWCGDTPALVIAFYRMFWSFLLFLILYLRHGRLGRRYQKLHPGDVRLILAAGVLLALHFATWIGSLKFTSVAHSLTLESTHPVIAILLSPLLLKERAEKRSRIAVVFTLLGIIIVAGVDLEFRTRQLWGDLLALSSALFVTLYLFVARHLRERIDLVTYLLYVYGAAMVVLLVFNFFIDASLYRYSWKVHFLLVLLALIPTGVGHSLLNWAARRVKAYKVNLTILGEPVLASILAFLFFREMPGKWFFVGAILILTGIGLAIFETSEVEQSSPEEIVDSGETNTH